MLTPREELDTVTNDREAARLRLDWEHLIASPNSDADTAAEYREAVRELDERWPGAHHESLIATEDELGGFSRGLREHRSKQRRTAGMDATEAAKHRAARNRAAAGGGRPRGEHTGAGAGPGAGAGGRSSSSGSRGSRRSSAYARGGRRAARDLGVTAAAGTATDVVLATMRIGLGLALAYLILTPRGSKGFAGVLGGITGAVRAIIAPVDPLAGRAPKPRGAAALGVITGAAQEAGPGSPGESGDPVATAKSLNAQLLALGLLKPRPNPTGARKRTTIGPTPGIGLPAFPTFGPPAVTWNTVPPHTATNP